MEFSYFQRQGEEQLVDIYSYLFQILGTFPNLESLSFQIVPNAQIQETIEAKNLPQLLSKQLKKLSVSNLWPIDQSFLGWLGNNSPELKELKDLEITTAAFPFRCRDFPAFLKTLANLPSLERFSSNYLLSAEQYKEVHSLLLQQRSGIKSLNLYTNEQFLLDFECSKSNTLQTLKLAPRAKFFSDSFLQSVSPTHIKASDTTDLEKAFSLLHPTSLELDQCSIPNIERLQVHWRSLTSLSLSSIS